MTRFDAIRALVLFALLVSDHTAVAGEFSAVVNGRSVHIGSDRDWNENNFGLGIEYQFETTSRWKSVLMASGFRDSDDNPSYAAGGGLHRNIVSSQSLDGLYVDIGLNAFLMSRQDVRGGRPFPGALPSLTVGNRLMGVNLAYVTKAAFRSVSDPRTMDKTMRGIVFVQLKINLTQLMRID